MPRIVVLAAALVISAPLSSGIASADEIGFLQRFEANWAGSGKVVRNADTEPAPVKVRCSMRGDGASNELVVDGTCSAYLLFSRAFGAKIAFNPATGLYRGTYEGATSGPATLAGRRTGDTVDLTVTWAKPVNGDRTARLSIRNDGRTLAIRMTDQAQGREITTTDLVFAQK